MPAHVRAELIGGIVYMASPLKRRHGQHGVQLIHWLAEYALHTPGTEPLENTTSILGSESEPEPDACLIVTPECGGQTWEDKSGYLNGSPEFIGEISYASESIDLNAKKDDYENASVREYLVVALRANRVFWFVRRRGKFRELSAGRDGVLRSEIFPGLWLDAKSLLERDGKRVLEVLREGLATPEHKAFVRKLQRKRGAN